MGRKKEAGKLHGLSDRTSDIILVVCYVWLLYFWWLIPFIMC